MVICEGFAWGHLPKTGGDATAKMLAAVPGLVTFADQHYSASRHFWFAARQIRIGNRMLVLNIRRLPSWALSAANHRARHGLHPEYVPLPLESPDEIASRADADDILNEMTDHGRFKVSRWLRCENLEEDVLSLLEELGVLTASARSAVTSVGAVNVGHYDHDVQSWFNDEQIERLYRLNPTWAAVERAVYDEPGASVR